MGFWLGRGALGRICVSPSFYSSAVNSSSAILRLPIDLKKNKEDEDPWVTRRKQKPSQKRKPSQKQEQSLMQRPSPSHGRSLRLSPGPVVEAAVPRCPAPSNTSCSSSRRTTASTTTSALSPAP